jgi:hypothetical protein
VQADKEALEAEADEDLVIILVQLMTTAVKAEVEGAAAMAVLGFIFTMHLTRQTALCHPAMQLYRVAMAAMAVQAVRGAALEAIAGEIMESMAVAGVAAMAATEATH